MDDMTLGIIYAIKQPHGETIKKSIINFMSDCTGTEKKYYSEETIKQILRNAFIDYLKTSDNPAFDVWQYFDAKRQRENFKDVFVEKFKEFLERKGEMDDDTEAIISALRRSKVKGETGKFINGFRDMEEKNNDKTH